MHVLLTGATGTVGRFLLPALAAAGHRVTTLGRTGDIPWTLGDPAPRLPPADALVHAALAHAPGAYRGGEGDDPAAFRRLNLDGTLRLFDAAGDARIVFLSSRAVYGDHRRGETLRETDPASPRLALRRGQARRRARPRPPRRLPPRHRRLRRPPAQMGPPLRRLPPRRAHRPAHRHRGPRRRPRRRRPPRSSTAADDRPLQRLRPPPRPPRPPRPRPGPHRLPAPAAAPRRRPAPRRHGHRPPRALGWRPGGLARLDAFLRRGIRDSEPVQAASTGRSLTRATTPPAASRSSRHRPAARSGCPSSAL